MNSRTYAAYAAMRAHQRGKEVQDGREKRILRIPPHKIVVTEQKTQITVLEEPQSIDVRA